MLLLVLINISIMVLEIFRQSEPNVYAANIFTPGINSLAYVSLIKLPFLLNLLNYFTLKDNAIIHCCA